MKCPRLVIDLGKIKKNAIYIKDLCSRNGVEVMGVTKGFCAHPVIAKAFYEAGIRNFGDSRIKNIKKLREAGIQGEMTLIRIPMISESDEVVKWADTSLNSQIEVLEALSSSAVDQGKTHKVILMVDVGDLREGVLPEDLEDLVRDTLKLKGIKITGLGCNVGCFGGVLPTRENTRILVNLAEELQKEFNLSIKVLSGGSTCGISLLEKGELPRGINQFRIGEGILLGRDSTGNRDIPGTYQDTMKLIAEVVELKEKPSVPVGEIGKDAFGNTPIFEDRGIRKRAILAIGRQDVDPENLIPLIRGVEVLGASSDHLILDVTDSEKEVSVGMEFPFRFTYGGMLRLMTSEYVEKVFI